MDNLHTVNKYEEGLEAFRQRAWNHALLLLSEIDPKDSHDPEHLVNLAIAAFMAGKEKESSDAWIQAHQKYLNQDNTERAARCVFWLGMQLINLGDNSRGNGWFVRARRLVVENRNKCVEEGYLLIPEALLSLGKGEADQAYTLFEKAQEFGKKFENRELMILAGLGAGQSLIRQGRIEEGTNYLDEAMVAIESDEVLPIVIGIVYCAVIETCQKMYDLQRAREWTMVLSQWCDSQPELVPFRDQCLIRRAEIMRLRGEWIEAMQEILRACKLFTKTSGKSAAGAAYYCKGEIHRLQGDYSEAEDAYRQASLWGKKPQPGLALLRLATGDIEVAENAIILEEIENQDMLNRTKLLPAFIEIMLTSGDYEKAVSAANELIEIANIVNAPYLHAIAAQMKGKVLLEKKDAIAALGSLQDALKILNKLNTPYETAQTRLLIGLTYRDLNDTDTAIMEINAARWVFHQLGASADLDKIDNISSKPELDMTFGLTNREQQVLRLLAAGNSNKEIALTMFVSNRTVDRHVSNIFAKLNVSSRSAATAFAFKHHLI